MKPRGGTEILKEQLLDQLDEKDLEDINLINSFCHPDFLKKDKINVLWQHLSYDQPNVQLMHDRRFVDQVDFFVYNSHWSFNQYREKFRIPEYKSFVIKNATFPFATTEKPPGKIKIIYTSTPWRGLSVLRLSIEYLNELRDDFEVDIYSSTKIYGSAFEKKEGAKFNELFEKCKNTKNIKHKGYVPYKEIREALCQAHIFAYPSIFEETSCLAAMEAMMAGCRIVTTNYGALSETCADFADMIEFEPNLGMLAKRYALMLNSVIEKYKNREYEKDINLQIQYYKRYYSWQNRIEEWRQFFNYARQTKKAP